MEQKVAADLIISPVPKKVGDQPEDQILDPQLLADWQYKVATEIAKIAANASSVSGDIKIQGGSDIPSDWLECNGQAVSRTTYFTLFGEIGTTYGEGNGSTTFNVPDLRAFIVDNTTAEFFTLDGPIKSPFTVIIKT